ncbi:MAG: peptidylprolyl isomerase [Actinomycetota bacterium]
MSTDSQSSSSSLVRRGLLAVLVIAVIGAGAWAVFNERPGEAIAASFRDDELTVDDLQQLLRDHPNTQSVAADPDTASGLLAADEITGWLITHAVLDELDARGAAPTDEQRTRVLELAAQSDIDPDTVYGQSVIRLQTTLVALQEYADGEARSVDAADLPGPEWICSSHILLETLDDALDVITELNAGMAFADAAVEFSTGPSGPEGGDLGCSSVERLVPEFVDGARASGAGTVSPPVQSQFGWHVIEVRAIGELNADDFPELDAETIAVELINNEAFARQAINDQTFTDVLDAARADVGAEGFVNEQFGVWSPERAFVAPPAGVTSNTPAG